MDPGGRRIFNNRQVLKARPNTLMMGDAVFGARGGTGSLGTGYRRYPEEKWRKDGTRPH